MFLRVREKKGKKVIPLNISEYLTPLALAVWVMDDGGRANNGVRIAANSFTLKEVELLSDVLKSKYNLENTIQNISSAKRARSEKTNILYILKNNLLII